MQKLVIAIAIPLLLAAGRFRRLSLIIPAITLGMFAVLLWLARRLYEGNFYKKATHLAEQGEHMAALGLLMVAEEAWAYNRLHYTPRTIRKDFRRFSMIIAAIEAEAHKLGGELDAEELMGVVSRYVDICSNKKNVVFGTNSLKAGASRELAQLEEVFPGLRGRFRAACEEFYEKLAPPVITIVTRPGPVEDESIVPRAFRDLDRVAAQEFAFLVDQRGSRPPTVEFGRDYFLVYLISGDLRVRVGMGRGTVGPDIYIDCQQERRLVLFHFPRLLAALGLPKVRARASEWPVYLKECARVLNDHFDSIVSRARSASHESKAAGIGTVVPEGMPVIGAGAHFLHERVLPIERDDFWRLTDRGFAPSYSAVTCPLCGVTGNMGTRMLMPTSVLAWFRKRPVEFFCPKCSQIFTVN